MRGVVGRAAAGLELQGAPVRVGRAAGTGVRDDRVVDRLVAAGVGGDEPGDPRVG